MAGTWKELPPLNSMPRLKPRTSDAQDRRSAGAHRRSRTSLPPADDVDAGLTPVEPASASGLARGAFVRPAPRVCSLIVRPPSLRAARTASAARCCPLQRPAQAADPRRQERRGTRQHGHDRVPEEEHHEQVEHGGQAQREGEAPHLARAESMYSTTAARIVTALAEMIVRRARAQARGTALRGLRPPGSRP